jgi:protein tyrosine phosphatase (PTP) superfamily phosphohydrolase (DUF442 family)
VNLETGKFGNQLGMLPIVPITPIAANMRKTNPMREINGRQVIGVSRPGYPIDFSNKSKVKVPNEYVQNWIAEATRIGIKEIICLLDFSEFKNYECDLLKEYVEAGFTVHHYPIRDYNNPRISLEVLKDILNDFEQMTGPVLIHCSAGQDRTGCLLEYLADPDGYNPVKYNNWFPTYDKDFYQARPKKTPAERITELECEILALRWDIDNILDKLKM